jgi:hypothetical protein
MSRGKVVRRPPWGSVSEDGVEDREQLAHAGHQGHLLRFAGRQETLVEFPYDRVVARSDQGAHVQHRARTSALPPHTLRWPRSVPESRFRGATPTRAASRLCVSVPSSGTPANRVRASTGHAPQECLVLTKDAAALDRSLQIALSVRESSFSSHLMWALIRLWPPAWEPRTGGCSLRLSSRAVACVGLL